MKDTSFSQPNRSISLTSSRWDLNETLSLYSALDTKTGRVHGKTAARHTSLEFVEFLGEVVSQCPPKQEIRIILDNRSRFSGSDPQVQLHFTPTYSSWLNQVEIWFAKIERDVIARGVFTPVPDLARKLGRYIHAYSANAPALSLEILGCPPPHP